MKYASNHLTDTPVWRIVCGWGGRTALSCALAATLGAGVLACSSEKSSTPSIPNAQAGTGGEVAANGGNGGNDAVSGTGGMALAGGPSSTEGALPEIVAGGGGQTGAADAGGVATAGGAGGAAGASAMGGAGGAAEDEWVPLFNGVNLDGWVLHGTNEPLFTVENGEMHVYPTQEDQSNQPQANLRNTTLLGGKYTLHVEYRWGEARFSDRRQTERDAGILFHVTGDVTRVWPDSIECQIGSSPVNGDWVTGDLWVLGTPTTAQTQNGNGQLQTHGGGFGFSAASAQAENPHGEWNSVDVIIDGATQAIYMVNGVEVNRVFNMTYNGQPLSEGFVSVQAEFAELFYRNIRYKLDE
jgi:hypothetical protein